MRADSAHVLKKRYFGGGTVQALLYRCSIVFFVRCPTGESRFSPCAEEEIFWWWHCPGIVI